MIKAVLIDDERQALRGLEHLLRNYPMIEIAGTFTNPLEAMEKIDKIDPRVVFLDINMPQLQGIDAASEILDRCPDCDIIFTTAYDQYAVEAFELHAMDYVLKPVSAERLGKTVQRIIKKQKHTVPQKGEKKLTIKAFGRFRIGWEGQEPIKWRTEKTKELLAFLLHNSGRAVAKDEILEAVFPDADPGKSVHQLHNGIYYIRKTLQEFGIDKKHIAIEGNYLMRLGEAETDFLLFEEYYNGIKTSEENRIILEKLESLYTGDYFEDGDWLWAEAKREQLRMQYLGAMLQLSDEYLKEGSFNKAEVLLRKIYEKDPYSEDVTSLLLRLYLNTNRRNDAVKHYRRYEKVLSEELGISPPPEIRKLLAEL
jgi:two-component SAPR family response regulator